MELTYRYRLYPTVTQQERIKNTCGCARFVYNQLLAQRTREYRQTLSWTETGLDLEKLLQRNVFLRQIDASALEWAKKQLEGAYQKFFCMEKKDDRYRPDAVARSQQEPDYELLQTDLAGYPRFKRKKQGTQSYATSAEKISIEQERDYSMKRVNLPGIGKVKIKFHRPFPEGAKPLYYTVVKKASGNYFLLVHLQLSDVPRRENLRQPMGIVFDPSHLAVRSDEEKVRFRHEDPATRKKMKKAKRILDRRVPGSKGYEKAYKRLAKIHEKRTNQRWDSQHKEARKITNDADSFFVETPAVRVRKPKWSVMPGMGRLIWDESWFKFSEMIRYKAVLDGKYFVQLPGTEIYRTCSMCMNPVPPIHKQDVWRCPICGRSMKSELNAARNLGIMGVKYLEMIRDAE